MSGQTLSRGAEVLQKYDYGYGQIDAAGNLDITKNNGQLAKIESYIGTAKQWTQKFNYDSTNRFTTNASYDMERKCKSFIIQIDWERSW